jgi:hypothetical protein
MFKQHNRLDTLFIILVFSLSPLFSATKAEKPVNLTGFNELITRTMAEMMLGVRF